MPGFTSSAIDRLWDYGNPAQTERKFRTLLEEARSQSPVDAGFELELLTQIARTEGLQHRFEQAHATLDSVESRMSEAGATARVRYLLERGRVFNSSKNAAVAEPLFRQAAELAMPEGLDFFAIDALHMLGIVEPQPATQLEWNLKAVSLAEQSSDERARGWLATLYNNIGWTYYGQRRFEEALDLFRRAIPLRERAGKPLPLRTAHYCVGKTLRALNRIDEALAIELVQHADAKSRSEGDGYICEEIAECLLAQVKTAEAKTFFALAFEALRDDIWLKRDEPERLARIEKLSK